jgi:hypothetical protein
MRGDHRFIGDLLALGATSQAVIDDKADFGCALLIASTWLGAGHITWR